MSWTFLRLKCASIATAVLVAHTSSASARSFLPHSVIKKIGKNLIFLPAAPTKDLFKNQQLQNAIGDIPKGEGATIEVAPAAPGPPSTMQATIVLPSSEQIPIVTSPLSATELAQKADDLNRRRAAEPASARSVFYDILTMLSDSDRQLPFISIPAAAGAGPAPAPMTPGQSLTVDAGQTGRLSSSQTLAILFANARLAGIHLDEDQLERLPSISRIKAAPSLARLVPIYQTMLTAMIDLLYEPRNSGKLQEYQTAATAVTDFILQNAVMLLDNIEARELVVSTLGRIESQSALKTVYGGLSNFAPKSYDLIYNYSRRSVGIASSGGAIICSGVALDARWIMTAGHCFKGSPATSMSVVFPATEGQTRFRVDIIDQWPSPAPGSRDSDSIDYSFVRIGDNERVSQLLSSLPASIKPICINKKPLNYRDPVFVIAFRGDDQKVHDYANVWYPFVLSEETYKMVEGSAMRSLTLTSEDLYPRNGPKRTEYVKEGMRDFINSYRKVAENDGPYYEYRANVGGTTNVRPYFGIDSDTFHGNSGAPVFSRNDTCIVGIFSGGRADNLVLDTSTWKEHEFAVPISEIVQDLKAKLDILKGDQTIDGQLLKSRVDLIDTLATLQKNAEVE